MKNLFLIDDDEDDREIFQAALEHLQLQYIYSEAINGEDAFLKLADETTSKPNIIFLDLNMPRIDGRQFLTTIKKMENLKEIPVIIYSTSSIEIDKKFAFDNGAAGFVTKHYSITDLCSELQTILN